MVSYAFKPSTVSQLPSRIKDLIFRNNCKQIADDDLDKRSASITAIEERISPQ